MVLLKGLAVDSFKHRVAIGAFGQGAVQRSSCAAAVRSLHCGSGGLLLTRAGAALRGHLVFRDLKTVPTQRMAFARHRGAGRLEVSMSGHFRPWSTTPHWDRRRPARQRFPRNCVSGPLPQLATPGFGWLHRQNIAAFHVGWCLDVFSPKAEPAFA